MLRAEIARLKTFFAKYPTYFATVDDQPTNLRIVIRGPNYDAIMAASAVANSQFNGYIKYIHQAVETGEQPD